MTGLSLGIDIGTSGVRTAVLDPDDNVLSTARTAHLPQDPDRIDATRWWTAVQACVHAQGKALKAIGYTPSDISRIGVDGTSGTMVLTDAHLRPVTRALMYNTSGFVQEADRIAAVAPATHITKGTNSALGRALRLQSEAGADKAAHLLHQADFVAACFMGRGGFSDENNTLKLGYDPEKGTWPDWLDQTGFRLNLLPDVVPAGALLGPISSAVSAQLGLSKSTVIHAGTTDSIAAFLAAAPLEPGAAVTSLGTTLAIKILSKHRVDAPEMGLYSHKLGGIWLAGGASNTGGGVLAQLFDPATLQNLSDQIDPAVASKLDYYPLIKPGERFPINDPDLKPKVTPRPENDAEFLHGLLESIARIEARSYAAIADRGGPSPQQLYTAGGGASNATWTRIRARVLGIEPRMSEHNEASIGTAKLISRLQG